MRLLTSLLIATLLIVVQATQSLAGRPLVVDDAGTVAPGHIEVEFGLSHSRAPAVAKETKRHFSSAFVTRSVHVWCSMPPPAEACVHRAQAYTARRTDLDAGYSKYVEALKPIRRCIEQ